MAGTKEWAKVEILFAIYYRMDDRFLPGNFLSYKAIYECLGKRRPILYSFNFIVVLNFWIFGNASYLYA